MKIYDISQEVFGCVVFPGDPVPQKEMVMRIDHGEICNLSSFSMCSHNGTHIDAPYHFINDGKTVDQIGLEYFVGYAYVSEHQGILSGEDAIHILEKARLLDTRCAKRILIKGKAEVSLEAAKVFADAKLSLLGNESQTVGPEDAPMEVHLALLEANVVLLEGIRLNEVSEGVYLLNAAPLNLGSVDGAPCRAILMEIE